MLRTIVAKIHRKVSSFKISTKILTFYCAVLIFSIALSGIIYQNIYNNNLSKKVSEVSVQTLYSISSNIMSMIENAKNLSKVIIASEEIQEPLKRIRYGSHTPVNPDSQRTINAHISKFIEAFPFINSIYIFDNDSHRYGIDKAQLKSLKIDSITDAGWYQDAVEAQGGFILKLNAGGIYEDLPGEKYISLIRVINDIYSQRPQGILIINISEGVFADSYKDILNKYETDIMILDEDGNTVVDFRNTTVSNIQSLLTSNSTKENTVVQPINGKDYLVSQLSMPLYSWNIISTIPFDELSKESNTFNVSTFSIIALNAVLMFLGSIVISRLIAYPIEKLLKSMKGVEKGEFKKVEIESGNDEIGRLRDAYNIMITEIQNLIRRVVDEEKIKRKAELNILQAQIKPHFLYNTFDAISSLALSGQNEQVYKVMKSLGSYYRISLSKGSEVITIAEEVEVVKNYMAIQQVRYGEIFSLYYDIDERATPYKILKLILQPLIENALYHGIKPKGDKGHIAVRVKHMETFIELAIEDDGVGMTEEAVNHLLSDEDEGTQKTSFGLRGTIERLKIFYGIPDPVCIESAKGEGTKVIIRIPIVKEDGTCLTATC